MHNTEFIETFDSQKLFLQRDLVDDSNAVLIIVHGLNGHQGRYDYLAGRLNGEGFSVYRFDNRGHGRSDGAQSYIEDFNTYLDDADTVYELVKKENPDLPIFMLGHSMGGFIAAGYDVKYPDKLAGQIISSAATNKLDAFSELEDLSLEDNPEMKLPNELGEFISRSDYVVDDYEKDPYVSKFITLKLMKVVFNEGIPWLIDNFDQYDCPVLILHGEGDQIVDPSCSEKFYDLIASEDKSFITYPELYHEILNSEDKEKVINDILGWLKERTDIRIDSKPE
ncbi:Lysophospholipase, alpha-beta hydrolase superfamily [Halanaerobium congolense]|jgi:alpha-beta hydrolase superfamily lysophospholipase|uniref:Lysophospholipase, alpha-beta hydrolase superfamily n=1 Tax=Halanaerobium congolense TaxID=54121 RepID=A0A1I0AXX7_9FIRM|nr:alpha/beta hydrolase [Halanaerobium congolense]PTX17364.1 alpha-beta hydrolase superfamily lysophospholipase [Halanaerobium congolense]SDF55946.1 Lysophospholipase, alpha-beta hydrolase superfamily [Halanaerobium congolense]SES98871.1 Lysophospholipase, alpha-beta hydrolase superfamily [Halanaerobium congolense]SFP34240.1 Lysophospholipase, alpha-beta hydrolase superfamily [Halanaerobium congolense]